MNFTLYVDWNNDSLNSSPAITPHSTDELHQSHGKINKKKHLETMKMSMRQKFDERKTLIIELFRTSGLFPSPKDIDEFLVSISLLDITFNYKQPITHFIFQNKHIELFGTKAYLNIKIREYRQKYMHQSGPKAAN